MVKGNTVEKFGGDRKIPTDLTMNLKAPENHNKTVQKTFGSLV